MSSPTKKVRVETVPVGDGSVSTLGVVASNTCPANEVVLQPIAAVDDDVDDDDDDEDRSVIGDYVEPNYNAVQRTIRFGPLEEVGAMIAGLADAAEALNAFAGCGRNCVHLAAKRGEPAVLKAVLGVKGVRAQVTTKGKDTNAFHYVAMSGKDVPQMVEMLAAAGAHPNYMYDRVFPHKPFSEMDESDEINTPLHDAVEKSTAAVVTALIKAGSVINAQQHCTLMTPLFLACSGVEHTSDRVAMVNSLLAAKAFVDSPDDEGRTPLTCAVLMGDIEVAELLLAAGASADHAEHSGPTPLAHAACTVRNPDMVRLILSQSKRRPKLHCPGWGVHNDVIRELLTAAKLICNTAKGSCMRHPMCQDPMESDGDLMGSDDEIF